jgi:hypothetical protein
VADGSPNSLGTTLGFDQSDGLAFFAARSDEMIRSYISFNLVWDSLFALVYGLLYISWLLALCRPVAHKTRVVDLLPALQVLFDRLENMVLAFLANQFVAEGSLSPIGVQTASIFSIAKWSLSVSVLVMVVAGIVFRIAQAVSKRA